MTSPTTNHLLHLLGDIERAVVFLAANPARREIGSQARNPNRPISREPISLDVVDAKREIPDAIGEIADRVYRERIISGAAQHGDGTEDSAFTFLRVRAAWIVGQPWAPEIFDQLLDLRSQVARLPGSPLLREVIGRTPCTQTGCDGHVTTRQQDRGHTVETTSRCDTCAHAYTEAAVDAARAEQADRLDWQEADTIVTTLLAAGVEVTVDQVHKWGDRHLIGRRKQAGRRRYLVEQVARRVRRDRQAAELQACSSSATVRVAGTTVSVCGDAT